MMRRCRLVGIGVEVCHGEWALRLQQPKQGPEALSLPAARDVELTATPSASCLPASNHDPQHDNDNGLKPLKL